MATRVPATVSRAYRRAVEGTEVEFARHGRESPGHLGKVVFRTVMPWALPVLRQGPVIGPAKLSRGGRI